MYLNHLKFDSPNSCITTILRPFVAELCLTWKKFLHFFLLNDVEKGKINILLKVQMSIIFPLWKSLFRNEWFMLEINDLWNIFSIFLFKQGNKQKKINFSCKYFCVVYIYFFSGTIKDKIFTASGRDVRGYTKKGKLFLDFDTNLTEPIRSMSISGSHLLT